MRDPLPPLASYLDKKTGFLVPHKKLGQHFILDPNLLASIASFARTEASEITIEIGPGLGGLTRAFLSQNEGRLVAIELDKRLRALGRDLQRHFPSRLDWVVGDARFLNFEALSRPVQLIGNLPYGVATHLLKGWFLNRKWIRKMVLMFSWEVARKIIAEPETADYGALSVLCQSWASVALVKRLPPACFVPPPSIESALLVLEPRLAALAESENAPDEVLQALVHAAFQQPRKMLRHKMAGWLDETMCDRLGVVPTMRAHQLTPRHYQMWARLMMERGGLAG